MTMVQTANKVKGIDMSGGPELPQALQDHLSDLHSRALQLQIIVAALENLIENGITDRKVTGALASVAVSISIDVQRDLDSVMVDRVLA